MKNIKFTILSLFLILSNLMGQGSEYNYMVLKNDLNMQMCKGVFELNQNLLIYNYEYIAIYNENGSVINSLSIPTNQRLDAISILDNKIYGAVYHDEKYIMKEYDSSLSELKSTNLEFLFSDFEKTENGYFFYTPYLNDDNTFLLFQTDNNFIKINSWFESSIGNRDIMIAPSLKMVRNDSKSIYLNLSGTGKIYDINENGTSSLVYNMATEPSNLTGNEEMNINTLKELSKNAPIHTYALNNKHIVFFSQIGGNHIYFHDRSSRETNRYGAALKYDLMDKFDFITTYPSTFLKERNKFAALIKGRDIHLVKEVVTPVSKTSHIPDCNSNDIILMTFNVD